MCFNWKNIFPVYGYIQKYTIIKTDSWYDKEKDSKAPQGEEPDYDLRIAIIKKKLSNINFELPDNFIKYIAENLNTNGRDIEGFLKRLKANHDIMGVNITQKEIDLLLNDFISKKIVTIDIIKEKVSDYYSITTADISSTKRNKELVLPRHVAMYLSRELAKKSFPEIAKAFGGKNHATVIHAVNKIQKDINNDKSLLSEINDIKNNLL